MDLKILLISLIFLTTSVIHGKTDDICDREVTIEEYQRYILGYHIFLFKRVAVKKDYHFAIPVVTTWLSLAAIAEGAEGTAQKQILQALNLPENTCLRQNIYNIAINNEPTATDLKITTQRILLHNELSTLNTSWADSVSRLITTKIKSRNKIVKELELSGQVPQLINHLVVGNYLEFKGLWKTTFPEAAIERNAPFYDDAGEKIGTVDLMKIRTRINMITMESKNMKLGELPLGKDGRYQFMFIVLTGNNVMMKEAADNFPEDLTLVIDEFLNKLHETAEPIEVAIPMFELTTDTVFTDNGLKDIGLESLWLDTNATKYISTPPAFPALLVQRVKLVIGSDGVNPYESIESEPTESFILNRPFMFAVVEQATKTIAFSGIYSKPLA